MIEVDDDIDLTDLVMWAVILSALDDGGDNRANYVEEEAPSQEEGIASTMVQQEPDRSYTNEGVEPNDVRYNDDNVSSSDGGGSSDSSSSDSGGGCD